MPFSGQTTPCNRTPRKRRIPQTPVQTPECFNRVNVETPIVSKTKASREKCDELRNLTVAVRIRPMNTRELNYVGVRRVVEVKDKSVFIQLNPHGVKYDTVKFHYDHVFCPSDHPDTQSTYATQQDVFLAIGKPLLDNAFGGYNACLFAYGQTGSGKSYSMMGAANCETTAGIIPRFCRELFNHIERLRATSTASVEISYFEIYNEKIHDLLCSNATVSHKTPLKVREHPTWGPYVVDLSTHAVKSYEEVRDLLLIGNKNRATTATAMNENSSRSHSIFSIELSLLDELTEGSGSRRSKVNLVDLAGSERHGSNYGSDEKYKEGVSINKSLLTLGKVISALADQRKGNQFVPYRESVLTWLLRESLGGNSLTCMLATITPASSNVDETLATLRYACQARFIVNRARINEDPHDRLIRELRAEVERLRALRQNYEQNSTTDTINLTVDSSLEIDDLRNKLNDKENELCEAQEIWERRFKETRQKQLQELSLAEKRKEELESHLRVMSSANADVTLTPYQTNFLEELENILGNANDVSNYIQSLKDVLEHSGSFVIHVDNSQSTVIIYDNLKQRKATCGIHQINDLLKNQSPQALINLLKWESDDMLTEKDLQSVMNRIYNEIDSLRFYTEKDEKLRLSFAKFVKSAQDFESALHSNVKENTKKGVTFRI